MAELETEQKFSWEAVQEELENTVDKRLLGLWSIIGPMVEITYTSQDLCFVDVDSFTTMITRDYIAYNLMKAILLYSNTIEKIRVLQPHTNPCNSEQSYQGIQVIMKDPTAKLVVESESKYIAILTTKEEDSEINLYFWELANCT